MPLLLIASERFGDHLTPPGHVERVERAHVFDAVATAWRKQGGLTDYVIISAQKA